MLRSAFRSYDKDGDSFLNRRELRVFLEDFGIFIGDGLSRDPDSHARQAILDRAFEMADTNCDGRISYKEFKEYHTRLASMLAMLKHSGLCERFRSCKKVENED